MNQAGMTQEEQDTLILLTDHIRFGRVTPQVPMYDLSISTGISSAFSNENRLKQWFKQGIVVWKTNQGLLDNYECRSQMSHRKISGVLYMSPTYVKQHIDVLYDINCEGLKARNLSVYTREQFDNILCALDKEYDFNHTQDNLSGKKKRKM